MEKFPAQNSAATVIQAVRNQISMGADSANQGRQDFDNLAERISRTSTEAYEVLNATNPGAYTEFIEHPELRVPNNERSKLNRDEIIGKLATLRELQAELDTGSRVGKYSDQQRRILDMAIKTNKLENGFVLACILYNDEPTEEHEILHRLTNKALYGEPDYDTFLALLNEQIGEIEAGDLSSEEQKEFQELKLLLGPVAKAQKDRYRPSQETIDRFADFIEVYFAPIFEHIPENQEEFSIQEAADIADEILREIVPDDSEWHAEVDQDRRAAAVSQQNKRIYFPGQRARQVYTRDELRRILVHELGTHALRGIPFEKHSVGILRSGLPGYEDFEEGLAKVMEQAIDREYQDAGARHYITIGLVNFMGKDFRDAYEIQKRLTYLRTGKDNDRIAYNSVQRALRGTDVLPNNKDLAYYNGNELVWKFIEQNLDDPKLFDKLFLSAKTNITNPEHEQIINEIKTGEI